MNDSRQILGPGLEDATNKTNELFKSYLFFVGLFLVFDLNMQNLIYQFLKT